MQSAELTSQDRERLLASGVDPDVLVALRLHQVTQGLSEKWHDQGNRLYLAEDVVVPATVLQKLDAFDPADALVVIAENLTAELLVLAEGRAATIFLGPETWLPFGSVFCGGGSQVVFHGDVRGTEKVVVDARNGGSVLVERDQLWAHNVYIATDDMHRLEDLGTGARLNPFGAHIRIGRHVWLGRDVVLSGHVEVGDGCVVGMRSLVRGQKLAPNTAVAGSPARVIREDIAWRIEDTP